jgi:hypothetical protein
MRWRVWRRRHRPWMSSGGVQDTPAARTTAIRRCGYTGLEYSEAFALMAMSGCPSSRFPIAGTKSTLEPSDLSGGPMRRTAVAGTVLALGLVTGCAGHDASSASSAHLGPASQPPAASPPQRPGRVATGLVDVSLNAAHVRGLTVAGAGSVAGEVALTSVATGVRRREAVPVGGALLRLPAGTYEVTTTVHDGACQPTTVTVTQGGVATVVVQCRDGLSTD